MAEQQNLFVILSHAQPGRLAVPLRPRVMVPRKSGVILSVASTAGVVGGLWSHLDERYAQAPHAPEACGETGPGKTTQLSKIALVRDLGKPGSLVGRFLLLVQ